MSEPGARTLLLAVVRPHYDVSFEPGAALRYIHKTRNGQHVYLFANLNPKLAESAVTLRGRHELEAWDPHTEGFSPSSPPTSNGRERTSPTSGSRCLL